MRQHVGTRKRRAPDRGRAAPTEILCLAMTERGGDGGVPDRAQMRTETTIDGYEPTIAGRCADVFIRERRDERTQPTAARARVCVHKDEDLACGIARADRNG